MNVPHSIEIEITETGEVKATVQGIAGPQCGPLSEFLDQLGVVEEDSETPDFYQTASAGDEVQAGW
ncbi:MAG: DUF2997 domain-containing protein [Anaerolineae bacterium]|nr:DUF2997 domain-containing protein [Anaerolineae bacterium]